MPIWFRAASYVMAALLVVCVVLQYNDPDPARWMLAYGACAVTSALLPSSRRLVPVGFLLAAAALGWSVLLVLGVWDRMAVSDLVDKMSEKGGAVEQGREAGGLLVAGLWLVFASAYRARRGR